MEQKTRAPRVVLSEKVRFLYADQYRCGFRAYGSLDEGFFLGGFGLVHQQIDRVYGMDMNLLWENKKRLIYQPTWFEHNQGDIQISFTDKVIYGGESWRGHRVVFLDGKNAESKYKQGECLPGLTFPYNFVKTIFDADGKLIWKQYGLKNVEYQSTKGEQQ